MKTVSIVPTKKFGVFSLEPSRSRDISTVTSSFTSTIAVFLAINCEYTRQIVVKLLNRGINQSSSSISSNSVSTASSERRDIFVVDIDDSGSYDHLNERLRATQHCVRVIQICDFENILWDRVLKGSEVASSYITRKGLSRKAQLSLQMKRYISKHPNSILKQSIPFTVVVDTWNGFDDMKIEFGLGTFVSFDSSMTSQMPLRQRLEWCLDDAKDAIFGKGREDWTWILKPSVTNKGADITLLDTKYSQDSNSADNSWTHLLDTLESLPDIREWVLQRYISKPLLVKGHKFHLRVYVLCVGALQVHVYNNILMLLAGRPYDPTDTDIYRHLTNTARAAEIENFKEELFVQLLDDLPGHLISDYPEKYSYSEIAETVKAQVLADIHNITADLFSAFENEYTIFNPMSNCFELFGLDFLVDIDCNVSLLEVNPGPDFKQTGGRLMRVIEGLWEQSLEIVMNANFTEDASLVKASDFSLVYNKIWSAGQLQGMKLA